ncbi:MAG TPA: COX15/CtaA family protein [Chitinophagaceae bacterium]|nr:COX15/CtaA family protein [Chitinophagaceae bacterium]
MKTTSEKLVGRWLMLGVIMLIIQVLLGGITRLTGSGLSITEWKPILGVIPPLNEAEWQIAFEKYQQIAQYKFLNTDFTLSDFKFIFFWEWFHRNWAHFIAVAFLIPFIYFLRHKMLTRDMAPKLIGLFLLGVGQGFIGKIMVDSGLNDENLYVNHIRLAIHFISAMILIAVTYWFALGKLVESRDRQHQPGLQRFSFFILLLLLVQLTYGAFMAGLKAATVAPTWPSINGDYLPSSVFSHSLIHHPINIHFIHRTLAYIILVLITVWSIRAYKLSTSTLFNRYKLLPAALVLLQVALGILTILWSTHVARNSFGPFEWMAQLHQVVAILLTLVMLWTVFMLQLERK